MNAPVGVMTEAESVALAAGLDAYRRVKEPAHKGLEEMLRAMQSPFAVAELRCKEELNAAVSCYADVASLSESGVPAERIREEALRCRSAVLTLESCTERLYGDLFAMMRDFQKHVEQRNGDQDAPRLPPPGGL